MEQRNNTVLAVAVAAVLMTALGIVFGLSNNLDINVYVLLGFLATSILFALQQASNRAIITVLIVTYIASSLVIREGYFGVNFDFISPILLLILAYAFIEKKQVSIVLASVALGLAAMFIVQIILMDWRMVVALTGSFLFYVAALFNVLRIHHVLQ